MIHETSTRRALLLTHLILAVQQHYGTPERAQNNAIDRVSRRHITFGIRYDLFSSRLSLSDKLDRRQEERAAWEEEDAPGSKSDRDREQQTSETADCSQQIRVIFSCKS